MTRTLGSYIQQVRTNMDNKLEPFTQQKAALQQFHRSQRKELLNKQKERKQREEIQCLRRLPKGFKALWSHMTGKYQKIRALNEREVKSCHIRDRDEKQALIDRQLTARQNLQDQIRPILRKHQGIITQLKTDVAKYMEMNDRGQKALQENPNQMNQKKQKQLNLTHAYGHAL